MSDNKKYYYLKLKENFFDSEEIKLLESIENGYLYSNILLKMFLKSLKTEGRLMFRENIPYNPKMLSTITGHNIDIVEKAIKVFKEFGLIQMLDSGAIYMEDIQSFIGESSSEADRKRLYRTKIDSEKKKLGHLSGHLSDKRAPELEIELEKDKELEIYTKKARARNDLTKEDIILKTDLENKFTYLLDDEFKSLWNDYLDMRTKMGKRFKATDKAIKLLLEKLHAVDLDKAIEMLKNSIERSWIGVFPIKDKNNLTQAQQYTYDSMKRLRDKLFREGKIDEFGNDIIQKKEASNEI